MKIIGGNYKGIKIYFYDIDNVRPTKNIIRKTFIYWLDEFLKDSQVLDLFAGTGILSFEALSYGAKYVKMFEKNKNAYKNILVNKNLLKLSYELNVQCMDAYLWIKKVNNLAYNIIILDPPYMCNLLIKCFIEIHRIKFISKLIFIYFEYNSSFILNKLPYDWILLKKKKIGNVYYYLAKKLT